MEIAKEAKENEKLEDPLHAREIDLNTPDQEIKTDEIKLILDNRGRKAIYENEIFILAMCINPNHYLVKNN